MCDGNTGKCSTCGQIVGIGDWPFCPHGRSALGVQPNDIPGGETLHNVGPEPVTFFSRSEKRRYLKEHGLVEMVRHVPVPGSDSSPHTTSWTAVDLEAGRILAERQATTKATTPEYRPNPETIEIIKQVTEEFHARYGRD
jgi:hypothetical protein